MEFLEALKIIHELAEQNALDEDGLDDDLFQEYLDQQEALKEIEKVLNQQVTFTVYTANGKESPFHAYDVLMGEFEYMDDAKILVEELLENDKNVQVRRKYVQQIESDYIWYNHALYMKRSIDYDDPE